MRFWVRLTQRGRIVFVLGMTLAAFGWTSRQQDIFWLGAFAVAVAIGALVMVSWRVSGLRHDRQVPVASVPLGTPFRVGLDISRTGRHGARLLHFEDVVPPSLGVRPRFAASRTIGETDRHLSYSLVGTQRGRHRLGPLLVRSLDPFGLARNDMAFSMQTEIAVTPRIHDLGRLAAGAAGASAESTKSQAGLVGQDDVLVRYYRRGDDVRRVHWRSTARVGSLMVRREEQAWQPTTRVIIDNRRRAHAGVGAQSSFEWAVSAAASIGLALLARGSTLEASDCDGPLLGSEREHAIRGQQLLDALTDIQLSAAPNLPADDLAGRDRHQGESVLAVLGRLADPDLAALLELRPGSGTAHALIIDVDTFAGAAPSADQTRLAARLVEQGWLVSVASADHSVPQAWQALSLGTTA